ncbi:hypothetical protein [Streptomyces boninensis]|uniref:hypothetical protein n=1 Tax=Streptomyces boninensis TaxID=2039455 RepID=UPI003B21942B
MSTDSLYTAVANDALRELLDSPRRRARLARRARRRRELRVRVGWALVEVGLRLVR